jgi:hypothetical protein
MSAMADPARRLAADIGGGHPGRFVKHLYGIVKTPQTAEEREKRERERKGGGGGGGLCLPPEEGGGG